MTIDLQELFIDGMDLDKKSIMALLKAIKNNHDARNFDYLKFKQSVSALLKMDMDEITSYKSAYATASTMGLTKDTLLKSASQYRQVLDYERDSFADALKNQIDQRIEGRKSEVDQLEQKIKDHKRKIKELEREIAIFQNRIDTVDQDVEMAQSKIDEAKDKFLKVYNVLNSAIKEDINSINNFL